MPLPESANRARAAAYARPAWEQHRDERPERPRPRQMRPAEVRQNDRNEGVRRQATDEITRSRAFRQGALSDTMMNEAGRNEVNTPPNAYFGQDVLEMTGAPALSRSMDAASVGDWPRALEQGAWGGLGVLGMATLPLAGGARPRATPTAAEPPPIGQLERAPPASGEFGSRGEGGYTAAHGALRNPQPAAASMAPRGPDAGNAGARSLSFEQRMDLRDARLAEAANEGFASPFGREMAYHASSTPWMRSGQAPDLSMGEGFGLHVGNRGAATQAAEARTRVGQRDRPPVYLEHVGVRTGGREIEMYDIHDWGSAQNWRVALDDGHIKGLTPEEAATLRARLDALGASERAGPQMNELLRSMGIRRVRYSNRFESRGDPSVIVLDPSDFRVIRTDGLSSVPDYASPNAPDGGRAGAEIASASPNAGTPQQRPGALRR